MSESQRPKVPDWVRSGRVPALDGLRGIAVLLLLLRHSVHTNGFTVPLIPQLVGPVELAPDIFFIVSGFLITLILRRQYARDKTVSPLAFYKRRFSRLFPPFAAYVLVIAAMAAMALVHVGWPTWVGTLTYTLNFVPQRDWELGHFWSLSIEEQFYLIWPVVILASRGSPLRLLIRCLVAMPVLRLFVWGFHPQHLDMIDSWSPTRADCILVGCSLGYLASNERFLRLTAHIHKRGLLFAACAVGVLVLSETLGWTITAYQVTVGYSVKAFCLGALLWTCVNSSWGPIYRLLHWRPLVQLGLMSYSIYIWQQPFLNPHSGHWACRWPANILLALAAAVISYRFIELPVMRWRGESTRASEPLSPVPMTRPSSAKPCSVPHVAAETCARCAIPLGAGEPERVLTRAG